MKRIETSLPGACLLVPDVFERARLELTRSGEYRAYFERHYRRRDESLRALGAPGRRLAGSRAGSGFPGHVRPDALAVTGAAARSAASVTSCRDFRN